MEGDVSPRTRARWAQSFKHTLDSPRARTKFRHFLENEFPRQPDSVQLDTLDFWEQCTNLVISTTLSGAARRASARHLAESVDSGDLLVNLDEGVLHRIFTATSTTSLKAALREAMQVVSSSDPDLQDAYRLFTSKLSQNPD